MTSPSSSLIANYASVHIKIDRTETMPDTETGMFDLLGRLGLPSRSQECFWAIAYDSVLGIRTVVEIGKGSYAKVPVHLPSLYTAVLSSGCDRFQIAHNHPAGSVKPTQNDIATTHAVMNGANALGLHFEDHWIVGPSGNSYSFRANGLLIPAPYTGELNA
jgi:DNA repair protein RadC